MVKEIENHRRQFEKWVAKTPSFRTSLPKPETDNPQGETSNDEEPSAFTDDQTAEDAVDGLQPSPHRHLLGLMVVCMVIPFICCGMLISSWLQPNRVRRHQEAAPDIPYLEFDAYNALPETQAKVKGYNLTNLIEQGTSRRLRFTGAKQPRQASLEERFGDHPDRIMENTSEDRYATGAECSSNSTSVDFAKSSTA